ncbi:MAG: FHA domain-containing protein [Anaerolineae bacterium]
MVTKPLNPSREPLDDGDSDGWEETLPPVEDTRPSPPPPDVTPERAGPAWRVLFHLSSGSKASTVGLDIWRVTVLGRSDAQSAFRPDLDYTPYGAVRYGVSRRHSLIRPGENNLYIIDQHSTNGTWVNGQRLAPGRDYPLTDGDVIELGALRMTLRIVQSPVDGASHSTRQQAPDDDPFEGRRFRFRR